MTIAFKPTASSTTIEQNGSAIATLDSNGLSMAAGKTIVGSGVGKVLQVVQTIFTGTQTITTPTNGAYTDITNLSASITPSSTSSKILILLNVTAMHQNDKIINLKMSGGNSATFLGNAANNRTRAAAWITGLSYTGQTMSLQYLDSPSTTSSITYTPQMGCNVNSNISINYNIINDTDINYITRGASSMILMEVAG